MMLEVQQLTKDLDLTLQESLTLKEKCSKEIISVKEQAQTCLKVLESLNSLIINPPRVLEVDRMLYQNGVEDYRGVQKMDLHVDDAKAVSVGGKRRIEGPHDNTLMLDAESDINASDPDPPVCPNAEEDFFDEECFEEKTENKHTTYTQSGHDDDDRDLYNSPPQQSHGKVSSNFDKQPPNRQRTQQAEVSETRDESNHQTNKFQSGLYQAKQGSPSSQFEGLGAKKLKDQPQKKQPHAGAELTDLLNISDRIDRPNKKNYYDNEDSIDKKQSHIDEEDFF